MISSSKVHYFRKNPKKVTSIKKQQQHFIIKSQVKAVGATVVDRWNTLNKRKDIGLNRIINS